ncbi:MAG: hypothetical protein QOH89_2837 [Pseudonocardiales bacterium]|nr:hypothetical protein [Pseudonocardiales bacterium]
MARSWFLLLATALACTVLAAGAFGNPPSASATVTYPLDPSRDLPIPDRAYGSACVNHPARDRCETIFVRALNRGRETLAAPAYALPAHFHSLTGREQLLVLANLDRRLYGRGSILGLNATLNASAERGAASAVDPAFVPVGGQSLQSGASNWAGGVHGALFAYFVWMYADGALGWEHRHNVLMQSPGDVLILGIGSAASASGYPSWTALLESFAPSSLIDCVPTVVLLSARSGTDPGATTLRILGLGFVHVRRVTFGGVPAAFDRESAAALLVTPPQHAPGKVRVQVVTRGGTSRLTAAAAYTY